MDTVELMAGETSVLPKEAFDSVPSFLFRHKAVRRYQIADAPNPPFDFIDFEMRLEGPNAEARKNRFLEICQDLPRQEAIHIVQVNEIAAASTEKIVSNTVVRGAMQATDILTGKDIQRLQAAKEADRARAAAAGQPVPAAEPKSLLAAFKL